MNVVIATTSVPFHDTSEDRIVDSLEMALLQHGHKVETYRFPFTDDWRLLPEQLTALRLIEIPDGDRMIAVRAPSYVIMHPGKVVWFAGHYRPAYDLWKSEYGIPDSSHGNATRDVIRRADDVGLDQARSVYASSETVSEQLREYGARNAEPLYPPLLAPDRYACEDAAGYVLYASRFDGSNRQSLAVEAMRYAKSPVRLILAGAVRPGAESYVDGLRRQIDEYGLHDRVELIARTAGGEEEVSLTNRASAVLCAPWSEISNVYPALEAAAARKPVIATSDCGAGCDLVVDGESGWVVAPTPAGLAAAFDEAFEDRIGTREKGEALAGSVRARNITWPSTLERLLA